MFGNRIVGVDRSNLSCESNLAFDGSSEIDARWRWRYSQFERVRLVEGINLHPRRKSGRIGNIHHCVGVLRILLAPNTTSLYGSGFLIWRIV